MAMTARVRVVRDRVDDVLAGLDVLLSKRVMVGIPSTNAGRRDGAMNNAAIAYVQEHGSPARNIPARPFLVPGIKTVQPRIVNMLLQATNFAIDGKPNAVDRVYNSMGIMAASAVQRKITEGPFAPLSPRTIAARIRRRKAGIRAFRSSAGFTALARPLIDTGQLRASITYVIRSVNTGRTFRQGRLSLPAALRKGVP